MESKKKKDKNFFKISHLLEERYGDKLSPSEKYFFVILLKLENRFANGEGWFWHTDKSFISKKIKGDMGFESYKFSVSSSKRARKKLKALGIIKTKYGHYESGNRSGTWYQINHRKFNKTYGSN